MNTVYLFWVAGRAVFKWVWRDEFEDDFKRCFECRESIRVSQYWALYRDVVVNRI